MSQKKHPLDPASDVKIKKSPQSPNTPESFPDPDIIPEAPPPRQKNNPTAGLHTDSQDQRKQNK